MATNPDEKLTQRKQIKSALERIDDVEQELPRIVAAVNEVLAGQNQRTAELAAILEAAVELLGAETVDAKVKEISERKVTQDLEKAQAALVAGLADGQLVKAEVIGEQTLVVGREFKEDGELVFPGRIQLTFAGIRAEFQAKLKGQGVGFTVETVDGGWFEVLEVYDVVEKPKFNGAPLVDGLPVEGEEWA